MRPFLSMLFSELSNWHPCRILSRVNNTEPKCFKLLRSPGIDSKESSPPAYAAWRVGTTTLVLFVQSPIDCSKILGFLFCISVWPEEKGDGAGWQGRPLDGSRQEKVVLNCFHSQKWLYSLLSCFWYENALYSTWNIFFVKNLYLFCLFVYELYIHVLPRLIKNFSNDGVL